MSRNIIVSITLGGVFVMASQNDYFGLGKVVSIILAIFFGPILSIIVRFMQGKILPAVIRLIILVTMVFSFIPWLLDIIWIAKDEKICDLGNIL